MNNLLTIKNSEIYIDTDILAKELKRNHQIITKLVKNYSNELKKLGILRFENHLITGKKGQPKKVYYLNKKQYIFLITNMRTKSNEIDTVMKAKLQIADMFVEMEKSLLQIHLNKQNEEWLNKRNKGKESRKEFTDILKKLLELTKELEPESTYVKKPKFLYSNFTRMIYKNLYDIQIKTKNLRDSMDEKQLSILDVAELSALKMIQECIDNGNDVKKTYKKTKEKIIEYANIVGKSTIIDLISSKQISMLDEGVK